MYVALMEQQIIQRRIKSFSECDRSCMLSLLITLLLFNRNDSYVCREMAVQSHYLSVALEGLGCTEPVVQIAAHVSRWPGCDESITFDVSYF